MALAKAPWKDECNINEAFYTIKKEYEKTRCPIPLGIVKNNSPQTGLDSPFCEELLRQDDSWSRMTNNIHPLRLGFIATTAALALSATPSFAQAADAPLITPPPVGSTAAAPAAAAPVVASEAVPAAGANGKGFSSSTIAPLDISEPETAAPVTTSAAATARPAASAARPDAGRTTRSAANATAAAIAAPRVAQAAPAPVIVPMPAAPKVAPEPSTVPAPTTAPNARAADDGEIVPIAIGGLALIGLAGFGFVLSRRRRVDLTEEDMVLSSEPSYAPAFAPAGLAAAGPEMPFALAAAPPAMAPAQRDDAAGAAEPGRIDRWGTAEATAFDTSRFGRHVRAAYEGPTPDNPFLSLKRRLKRASFMDQRERAGTAPAAMTSPPTQATEPPARTAEDSGYVTTRAPRQPRPGFRPAFQS